MASSLAMHCLWKEGCPAESAGLSAYMLPPGIKSTAKLLLQCRGAALGARCTDSFAAGPRIPEREGECDSDVFADNTEYE